MSQETETTAAPPEDAASAGKGARTGAIVIALLIVISLVLYFAGDRITERAAIPKAIRLVAAMPLTGVGKIFKPELRQREIVDALRTALHDAAAPASRLEVVNDPRFGIQVEVTVAGRATAGIARGVLGRFPFRFEVTWTSCDR